MVTDPCDEGGRRGPYGPLPPTVTPIASSYGTASSSGRLIKSSNLHQEEVHINAAAPDIHMFAVVLLHQGFVHADFDGYDDTRYPVGAITTGKLGYLMSNIFTQRLALRQIVHVVSRPGEPISCCIIFIKSSFFPRV